MWPVRLCDQAKEAFRAALTLLARIPELAYPGSDRGRRQGCLAPRLVWRDYARRRRPSRRLGEDRRAPYRTKAELLNQAVDYAIAGDLRAIPILEHVP